MVGYCLRGQFLVCKRFVGSYFPNCLQARPCVYASSPKFILKYMENRQAKMIYCRKNFIRIQESLCLFTNEKKYLSISKYWNLPAFDLRNILAISWQAPHQLFIQVFLNKGNMQFLCGWYPKTDIPIATKRFFLLIKTTMNLKLSCKTLRISSITIPSRLPKIAKSNNCKHERIKRP